MANNGMDINSDSPTNSPALSYETEQEKLLCYSKTTVIMNNMRPQNGNNMAPSIQLEHAGHNIPNEPKPCTAAPCNNDDNVINIQLPYNPDAPTEPELWSGSFYLISLHGSIKQIASDTKSIKDSLNFMAKYIVNKKVNPKTANNLQNFDGIGDSVWNFIFTVYQAGWDSLHTDNRSKTLREKILSKFTPRITPNNTKKNSKELPNSIPVSLDKVPLPPPLPAKSAKEVNAIPKYFQNKKSPSISRLMLKPLSHRHLCLMFSKLRKHSWHSMLRKLTKSTTSSKKIQS